MKISCGLETLAVLENMIKSDFMKDFGFEEIFLWAFFRSVLEALQITFQTITSVESRHPAILKATQHSKLQSEGIKTKENAQANKSFFIWYLKLKR